MYLSDRGAVPADTRVGGSRRRLAGVSGTVLAMGTVSLLTDISSESVAAVLPVYLTTVLGLSPLAYGVVDGIYQGASAIFRIAAGRVSDRVDRPKWVAFSGYALSALTKPILLFVNGFGAITGLIAVDRLGKGIRTAPRDALIAAATPSEHLGRAFGVHRSLDTAGALAGPLIAFGLLALVPGDYASVFVVSTCAALLGLAVLWLVVPDLRPGKAARAAAPAAPAPSVRTMLDAGLGRLVAVAGLLSLLAVGDGFLYLALQRRDEFAAVWYPLLFVGTNAAYLLLAVPCGRLADRFGRARVLVLGQFFLVAAYVCAGLPSGGVLLTIACLLCLGTFYASTDGVLAALTAGRLPASTRATGIATTQTVVALGRFGASLTFGALWTLGGRQAAVLALAGALALAVPIAWRLLKGLDGPVPETVS